MSWRKFGIFALGLLLIGTAVASAEKIEGFTDDKGTIHITNPKPGKPTDKATDEEAEKAANKIIYRDDDINKKGSRPRSRRPIDPSTSYFGAPTKVRPSPYAPPPQPDIGKASPPSAATPVLKSPPSQAPAPAVPPAQLESPSPPKSP
jgi:hypothetical protein